MKRRNNEDLLAEIILEVFQDNKYENATIKVFSDNTFESDVPDHILRNHLEAVIKDKRNHLVALTTKVNQTNYELEKLIDIRKYLEEQ